MTTQACCRALRIAFLAMAVVLCRASSFAADQYILPTAPSVAGASVFVDGAPAGMTDENGKIVLSGVTPGVHLLRLESAGEIYAEEKTFDSELNSLPPFNIGESTRQSTGASANIDYVIDANVAGADIAVDGAAQSITDSAGRATLHLAAGQTHTIEIRKEGFDTHVETITAAAKSERKVVLQQNPATSRHRVDVLLIVLIILLAGSVTLLLAMLLRHRARVTAPPMPSRVSAAVTEQTGGHFDRYQLISQLGSGGVATIYRAHDLIDKTMIALKVLDARWLSDPDMVRKFLAEGEALCAIAKGDGSAAVVKCFRYGREHESIVGRPFIALELLEGETLQSLLAREPLLDYSTAVAIGYQIASALVAVHAAGIVHRDLTPDNIFLKRGERIVGGTRFSVPVVVLIDFGIARQDLMSRMTLDGSIAGKPHYMSPEQCRGGIVDTRGDLYSLGIILYLLAAGRLPFAGRDPFEVMRAQMTDEPPRLPNEVDHRYADVCGRLLQKAPDNRPRSAAEVADELEQILFSSGASPSMNVVTFPTRRASL
jgi:hypothetical protein